MNQLCSRTGHAPAEVHVVGLMQELLALHVTEAKLLTTLQLEPQQIPLAGAFWLRVLMSCGE